MPRFDALLTVLTVYFWTQKGTACLRRAAASAAGLRQRNRLAPGPGVERETLSLTAGRLTPGFFFMGCLVISSHIGVGLRSRPAST